MYAHAQSWLFLCNPMECSPPGPSCHRIFQARTVEWVVISSSRGTSSLRNWICISCASCTGSKFFTTEPAGKPLTTAATPSYLPQISNSPWLGANCAAEVPQSYCGILSWGKLFMRQEWSFPPVPAEGKSPGGRRVCGSCRRRGRVRGKARPTPRRPARSWEQRGPQAERQGRSADQHNDPARPPPLCLWGRRFGSKPGPPPERGGAAKHWDTGDGSGAPRELRTRDTVWPAEPPFLWLCRGTHRPGSHLLCSLLSLSERLTLSSHCPEANS